MKKIMRRVACGGVIGFISGLFGGGGGMVCVPVLEGLGISEKRAHATAILIIAPVCLICAAAYILKGSVKGEVLIPAAIGNCLGGVLGAKLLGKLPAFWVNLIFVIIMFAAGIRMTFF